MILKSKSKEVFDVELDLDELRILAFALGSAFAGPADDDDAKFQQRFGWRAPGPPPSKQELMSMRKTACDCIDLLRTSE